jgi:lipopolysaccharide/colanic/teichoic acid biosynthesis glycosyltransferase
MSHSIGLRPVLAGGRNVTFELAIKRAMDLAISVPMLVVLSPFLATIALGVRLSSKGPVLYTCHWVGQDGRRFSGWKFRTMVENADALEAELQAHNEMTGPAFKMTRDPRVTGFGRFLRKFSLDELPQLWNVVKGDLSLVGPRAPREHEYAQFTEFQKQKLTVQPGITCLWQVEGRHRISDYDRWVELDLDYIRRWSLWLDVQILAKTALVVLRGTGV